MFAVLTIPLVSLAYLAATRIDEVRSRRADVAQTAAALDDLVGLRELRSRLIGEKYWDYSVRILDEIGIPRDLVVDMTDLDPWAQLEDARERVDSVATDRRFAPIADRLDEVRSDAELSALAANRRYAAVEADLNSEMEEAASHLVALPSTPELGASVQVFQTASAASDNAALMLGTMFSVQFPSGLGETESLRRLVASHDGYERDLDDLRSLAVPGTPVGDALGEVDLDPDVIHFRARIADTVDQTLSGGADATDGVPLSGQIDAATIDDLKSTYLTGESAVGQHGALANLAGAEVTSHADRLDAAAENEVQRTVALALLASLLAVVGAAFAVRSIIGPLRRIASVADDMRTGSLDSRAPERGPHELRSAAKTLNEAVDQLQLSERQALALARGDLDDPVLATQIPGPLGQSLRDAVSQLASSLTDREEFRRRLADAAAHDVLTGLPNRSAALTHVGRALGRSQRTNESVALLVVDLEQFQHVNDTYGHSGGDRVLTEIAGRLHGAVRQSDVVGRIGADEFLVVAEPIADPDEAEQLAQRLISVIEEPMMVAGATVSVGACVGITVHDGSLEPDELLREALAATSSAKKQGRGRIHFCDDDLRRRLAHRNEIERGLLHAIEHDELVLHVQELVRARDESPVSLEALVRWVQPDRGVIPPGDFIPVAEQSDLIVSLDRWVLERAAAHLSEWTTDAVRGGHSLAVNISERHLTHSGLVDHVLGPLRRHGVDPSRLTVEVTETALLDDIAVAARHLDELRAAGVRVAIDDFGTGYTSLTHLRALPVDVIKIDRSFVANLARDDERSLVRMIVEVGHLFGYEVVAEGVETALEARELLSLGVDVLQGFHYSRPTLVELGTKSGDRLQPAI